MNVLLLGLITGIAFGYVLFRVGVSQCACLFNALSLNNLKAIKVMASAIAVGILILYPIAAAGGVQLGGKTLYVGAIVVGGAIFGIGFALSGLCPGTALAALGAGKKDVWYLMAGALFGSFAYALSYDGLKPVLIDRANYGAVTLPALFGASPLVTGYGFAILLLAAVFLLDRRDRNVGATDPGACTFRPAGKPPQRWDPTITVHK